MLRRRRVRWVEGCENEYKWLDMRMIALFQSPQVPRDRPVGGGGVGAKTVNQL